MAQEKVSSSVGQIADGFVGVGIMTSAWLTPFLRSVRNHWGLTPSEAAARRPGDELVPKPAWSWTHAIEVDASVGEVWPWLLQLGADRGGFYSYEFLENLVGCNIKNANSIHPDWALRVGDALRLHPDMPAFSIVGIEPERSLIAFAAPNAEAQGSGKPWASASWAFLLEPLTGGRCQILSRFRSSYSDHVISRITQGPLFLEPIGFAMDRKMLLGIAQRVRLVREEKGPNVS